MYWISKGIVSYKDGTLTLLETGVINVWESKEDVKKEELNQTEEKAFEIIKEIAKRIWTGIKNPS